MLLELMFSFFAQLSSMGNPLSIANAKSSNNNCTQHDAYKFNGGVQ